MNRRHFQRGHLKFLLAGVLFVVLMDRFVMGGTRPYIEEARHGAHTEVVFRQQEVFAPEPDKPFELARIEPAVKTYREYSEALGPRDLPDWRKYAVPVDIDPAKKKVIIVIDDVGVSRKYSQEALELPGPLTLAFLPYARGLEDMVDDASGHGHEIMVHMPMEPENGELDMGGIFLSTEQAPGEFDKMLSRGLSAFGGFVGLNNHMGSKLTQDRAAMERVMAELARRGVLFLDSRTISSSVAAETAADFGVPYAIRDVFLDHDESLEGVRKQLALTERVAQEHGQAIAIGHPKANTIAALEEWLPTLEEKGLQLVPVSAVVIRTPSLAKSGGTDAPPEAPATQHQ